MVPEDPPKNERAANLFRLLLEFARMRQRAVLHVRQYEEVLWFHDLPDSPHCVSAMDTATADGSRPEEWIRVERVHEPRCPRPAPLLEPWLSSSYPFSADPEDEPKLREWIATESTKEVANDEEPSLSDASVSTRRYARDEPGLDDLYAEYVIGDWFDWTQRHASWSEHHAVYSQLFAMYQALQRLGEQYEIVLGWGLLTWSDDRAQEIQRHLLTTLVLLEFDHRRESSQSLQVLRESTYNWRTRCSQLQHEAGWM